MNDCTVVFTVGGDSHHYENMFRCIRSFERMTSKPKILILEFGRNLSSCEDYDVVDLHDVIDFSISKKVGYIIWRHKYVGALLVKTRYGIYIDTDTVVASKELEKITNSLNNQIAVSPHFWVPTINDYKNKAVPPDKFEIFQKVFSDLKLTDETKFYAGGLFAFENTHDVRNVFQKTLEYNDSFYSSRNDYVSSITDELFFAAALGESKNLIKEIGGGFNHCSMGDEHMPLMLQNNELWGRNPFDKIWNRVSVLHCDIARRDPSKEYKDSLKEKIHELFYMQR
jgi:hypothetical protein